MMQIESKLETKQQEEEKTEEILVLVSLND
jgi:hypothetical protein